MTKKIQNPGPSFFDLMDAEDEKIAASKPKVSPEQCPGHEQLKGYYVWPGETMERLVWFCKHCTMIWGRC